MFTIFLVRTLVQATTGRKDRIRKIIMNGKLLRIITVYKRKSVRMISEYFEEDSTCVFCSPISTSAEAISGNKQTCVPRILRFSL